MIALISPAFDRTEPCRVRNHRSHHPRVAQPISISQSCWAFIEFAGAIVGLLFASPVIGVAALLIKLTSSGPAFYKQVRLGKNGREFSLLKLRTMYHDCERLTGACWSVPGDSRITAIGRLLRKLHIDELPQLWNVVRGDMRFVGPRPERPEIAANLVESILDYDRRLQVAPGITGLAQILLPPDVSLQSVRRKLAYDLYFMENSRAGLYVRILLGTILHILRVPFTAIRFGLALPCLEDQKISLQRSERMGKRSNQPLLSEHQLRKYEPSRR